MRYAYFYFMTDDTVRIREVAPEHATYWHDLRLPAYVGGPFADRSGGMVTFEASSVAEASSLAEEDPFRREELIEQHWLKEWHT